MDTWQDVGDSDSVADDTMGTAPDSEPTAGPGDSLTNEVKQLGEKLAAALRAAASTPEAESLRGDLREGMEGLRRELERALQRSPRSEAEGSAPSPSPSGAARRLRAEVAGWVREANRALDRMADALQGTPTGEVGEAAESGDDEVASGT